MFTGTQSRLYPHGYTASLGVGTAAPTLGKLAVGAAGSAAAPALTFTAFEPNTGFYVTAAGKFGLSVSGVLKYDYSITSATSHTFNSDVRCNANFTVVQNGGVVCLRNFNTLLSSPASAVFQFGNADAAAPVAQTIQAQSVVAGNANTAGATFTIGGSKSNGSGGGDVVLQTTLANAASGTQNTLATALTLKGGTQAVVTSAGVGDTGYQYATPTTGQTVTLTASNYHCIIDPAGTLATLTVALPAGFDGQYVDVKFSQAITSLTVSSSGNTVKGAPTSAALGASFTAIYRASNTTWYI